MHKRPIRGATLVELVLVIIIVGILSTIIGRILMTGFNNYFSGKQSFHLNTMANIAMTQMSRELRTATNITTRLSQQIVFTTYDGISIQYRLDGGDLKRSQDGGSEYILSSHVSSLQFLYYDVDNDPTPPSINATRLIEISFSLADDFNQYDLKTVISMRAVS